MTTTPRVLGRTMVALGLLCAAGMSFLAADALEDWTRNLDRAVRVAEARAAGRPTFMDLSVSCGPFHSLGAFSFLAALVWLPAAAWRIARGRRDGRTLRRSEALAVAAVCSMLLVVPWAFWLAATPYHWT